MQFEQDVILKRTSCSVEFAKRIDMLALYRKSTKCIIIVANENVCATKIRLINVDHNSKKKKKENKTVLLHSTSISDANVVIHPKLKHVRRRNKRFIYLNGTSEGHSNERMMWCDERETWPMLRDIRCDTCVPGKHVCCAMSRFVQCFSVFAWTCLNLHIYTQGRARHPIFVQSFNSNWKTEIASFARQYICNNKNDIANFARRLQNSWCSS